VSGVRHPGHDADAAGVWMELASMVAGRQLNVLSLAAWLEEAGVAGRRRRLAYGSRHGRR
jgi:hypothetical protein